jgi:uncharacterized membrane protein YedE/YeeE
MDEAKTQVSQRLLGLLFGIIFGFLLQKGGVGQYDILVGALLLRDFTVFKIILSAILVGMVGVFTMHRLGLVKLHIKPLRYGPNIIGGLIFGLGFGLSGYCPGTGAVALAQGSYDALFAMLGLVAGSYAYAEMSGFLSRTILTWGDRGKLTFPDVVPVPRPAIIGGTAVLIALALLLL